MFVAYTQLNYLGAMTCIFTAQTCVTELRHGQTTSNELHLASLCILAAHSGFLKLYRKQPVNGDLLFTTISHNTQLLKIWLIV